METVGAYAFSFDDWQELEYPLDLWIKYNSKFFDELSLVFIGDRNKLPEINENNIKVTYIREAKEKNWDIYRLYKQIAQSQLSTDWKLLLDIDEFVNNKIDVTTLRKDRIYAIKMRHLYLNTHTEVLNAFPDYYWRFHYGVIPVIRDGSIDGKKMQRISPHLVKKFWYQLLHNGIRRMIYKPEIVAEVWHTNALRSPNAIMNKRKIQIERENAEKGSCVRVDNNFYEYLNSQFEIREAIPPMDLVKYYG